MQSENYFLSRLPSHAAPLGICKVPLTVAHWDRFGKEWITDPVKHLELLNTTELEADYADIPNLSISDKTSYLFFNGTTSGMLVPEETRFSCRRS